MRFSRLHGPHHREPGARATMSRLHVPSRHSNVTKNSEGDERGFPCERSRSNSAVLLLTLFGRRDHSDGTTRADALAASDPSMTCEAQGGRGHAVSGDLAVQRDHTALS